MSHLTLFPDTSETIAGTASELKAGRTSCQQVLNRCLDRIDQFEPQIQAWVCIDRDSAKQQASSLDEEIRRGNYRGPLHGIPVGVKDIIDVQGLTTKGGANDWAAGPAITDAPLVAALREAGAIILGKTVTTAYAWIDPPRTRNPWNLNRTPGGSSSGSAAAVATGMSLAAIGTQTGGSIIRPASFCGVTGLKPSLFRVSTAGIMPFSRNLDTPGPIARTVADLEILLKAISREPWNDPETPAKSPRLCRLRGFFEERAEPAVRVAIDRALEQLSRAGADVVEAELPDGFDQIHRQHRIVMASEAAHIHEQRLAKIPDDYPPRIRSLIEEGSAIRAPTYLEAIEHMMRVRIRTILPEHVDAFVVPSTTQPAPDPSTTGDPAFNSPWTYTGQPAVTIPIGFAPDGLPLGLQIVGTFGEDEQLLSIAGWCETVLKTGLVESATAEVGHV